MKAPESPQLKHYRAHREEINEKRKTFRKTPEGKRRIREQNRKYYLKRQALETKE